MTFIKQNKGSITVFLSIILIPTVISVAVFVDMVRYNTAKTIITGAVDLTLDSVLANYNYTLKSEYGLFAVSYEEDLSQSCNNYLYSNISLKEEDSFSKILGLNINKVDIDYINNSTLVNSNILKKQIIEHSKYRAPIEIGQDIYSYLKDIKNIATESECFYNEIEFNKQLSICSLQQQTLYELILLNDNFSSTEYNEGINQINLHSAKIESLLTGLAEDYSSLKDSYDKEFSEELILVYEDRINEKVNSIRNRAESIVNIKTELLAYYRNYEAINDEITAKCNKLIEQENIIHNMLKENFKALNYTDNLTENEKEEIKKIYEKMESNYKKLLDIDYEIIKSYIKDNESIYSDLIYKVSVINFFYINNNKINKIDLTKLKKLSYKVYTDVAKTPPYLLSLSSKKYMIDDYTAPNKKFSSSINTKIKKIYELLDNTYKKRIESATKNITKKAKNLMKNSVKKLFSSNDNSSIPKQIYSNFSSETLSDKIAISNDASIEYSQDIFRSISSYFKDVPLNVRDELLINHYIINNFSSHVNNLENSNYPRYLEDGEQEYLVFGNRNSKLNKLSAQSLIFTLRFMLNYKFAYFNNEVQTIVNELALLASLTCPIALPVLKSLILISIVTAETAIDLTEINDGKDVVLIKDINNWNLSISGIEKYFSGNSNTLESSNSNKSKIMFGYEDYLKVMLLISNQDVILKRVGNLIELNLSYLECNDKESFNQLTCFLSKTYTAVKIRVEADTQMLFHKLLSKNSTNKPLITHVTLKGY